MIIKHSHLFFTIFLLFAFSSGLTRADEKPVWAYKDFAGFNSTRFIENKGQLTDSEGNLRSDIKFYLNSGNLTVYFTSNSVIYTFHKQKRNTKNRDNNLLSAECDKFNDLRTLPELEYFSTEMKFKNTNPGTRMKGENPNDEVLNFYYSHCPDGITNVKTYNRIVYQNIYEGIDLVFYANGNKFGFKYDFIVRNNANPSNIKLQYKNAEIKKQANGTVAILCANYKILETQPFSFQRNNKKQNKIASDFLVDKNTLSFNIGNYDRSKDLIIDPIINWSTYYGGSDGDHSSSIAIDNQANIVIAGQTLSKDLPVTNGSNYSGEFDIFIAKFDYTGKRIWATYYGGKGADYAGKVFVDPAAHIYVTGWTWDKNFPVSSGCFQSQHLGGYNDGILIKFNRNGQRQWATYVGGSSEEHLYALTIDNQFNVITAGWSRSRDFPNGKPPVSLKRNFDDIALVSFTSNGEYRWSTFLGGDSVETANDLAFDISGNIVLIGSTHSKNLTLTHDAQQLQLGGFWDAVIAKFSITGILMYSSYLGGSLDDFGTAIEIDSKNSLFVSGYTRSRDFPVTNNAFQKDNNGFINCFLTKFSQVNAILNSTYLGGSKEDYSFSMAVDKSDNIMITGQTSSADFPATPNAVQNYLKGNSDVFGAKFTNDLTSAYWITFYGGDSDDLGKGITVDFYQNIYITGSTISADFPVTDDAFQKDLAGQYDCFIFKHCATSPYTEIKINGKTTFCKGESVELDAGPGFLFYQWSNGETTQKIIVTKSGSYTVHITDSMYCDFTTIPVLINVIPLPEPEIEGNPKFCEGDSAVLTVPDGYKSWEWSNGSKEKTIVLHNDQRIILSVTNENDCTGYDTVDVKEYPRPKPLIHGPSAVCVNATNMKYFVYGHAGNTYNWEIIGGTINTGQDYFNIQVDWTVPGTGMLVITETNNASGCIGVDTLFVEVTDHLEPEITSDKNRFIMCEGDSMTLDAGYGFKEYLWNTGSKRQYIGVTEAGKYFVRVIAEGDCEGYDTVIVETRPVPAPVINGDTEVCAESYELIYLTGFDPEHKYFWEVTNGEIVKDDSTNTITINWLNPGKATITVVEYDTLTECSGTAEIEITIRPKPDVKISALGDIEFCEGDSVILDAGGNLKTYIWNTGNTSRFLTVKQSGIYSVTAFNEFDCSNSDSIQITVFPKPPKPVITSIEDTLYSSPGDTYFWYRNDTLLSGVNGQWFVSHIDGDYKVIHRNANGCESESDIYKYKYIPIVGLSVISMPDTIYVKTGDPVIIPISIEQSNLLDKIEANIFTAKLSFDGTVLVPDDINIPFTRDGNMKSIIITGKRTDTIGVIYTLYLHAALGDSVCTNVIIDSLYWDSYRDVEVITSGTTVCLTNICRADGSRFYLESGNLRLEQNRPNPAQEYTTIEFESIESGHHKLSLVNIFGNNIATVYEGNIKPGIYTFELNTSNIPSGVYYYILQTPTRIIRAKMQVIK